MATIRKTIHRVEVNYVKCNLCANSTFPKRSFKDLLLSEEAKKYKHYGEDKDFSIHIEPITDSKHIVGYVKTSQHSNIPPKIKEDGSMEAIIGNREKGGIGFSNIFFYDIEKECLYYEVHNNGCSMGMFFALFIEMYKNEDRSSNYEVQASPAFDKNEYNRIMEFPKYTKIRLEIFAPLQVLKEFGDETNPILSSLQDSVAVGAEKVVIEHKLEQYSKNALDNGYIQKIVRFVKHKLMPNKNVGHLINKLEVTGKGEYKRSSDTIDLIGETIDGRISIESKKSHSDLQIIEKRSAIFDVYSVLDKKVLKLS